MAQTGQSWSGGAARRPMVRIPVMAIKHTEMRHELSQLPCFRERQCFLELAVTTAVWEYVLSKHCVELQECVRDEIAAWASIWEHLDGWSSAVLWQSLAIFVLFVFQVVGFGAQ